MREVPICTIAFDPSGAFEFRVHFSGRPPHWRIDGFPTIDATLNWIDPHRERIWEEPSDGDEAKVFISRAYVSGARTAACSPGYDCPLCRIAPV